MSGLAVRQHVARVGVPIVTVAGAMIFTHHVEALREKATLFVYLAAVMLSAWWGGLFSGFLATGLAAVAAAWYLPPANSFAIANPDEFFRWILFILVALMISSLHAARSRAEAELRRSEQRLSLAVDSARMGIWDYHLLERSFWWSKTLEAIYDRTDGSFPESYGQFFAMIHFDDQPGFNRSITRTIDEGTDYEIEYRVMLPDKSWRWVHTRGRVFFNELARAERIVGVTTDISQRKKVEFERAEVLV